NRVAPTRVGKRRWCAMQRMEPECLAVAQIENAELGFANTRRVRQNGVKHRLQFAGRPRDDTQHPRGRGLLLPRLGELARARLELDFQLDQRIGPVANVRSRLRSGRTKAAAARWALCAFERQGHLVGTATGLVRSGPAKDRGYQS